MVQSAVGVMKGQGGVITRAPNHCGALKYCGGAEWLRGR